MVSRRDDADINRAAEGLRPTEMGSGTDPHGNLPGYTLRQVSSPVDVSVHACREGRLRTHRSITHNPVVERYTPSQSQVLDTIDRRAARCQQICYTLTIRVSTRLAKALWKAL